MGLTKSKQQNISKKNISKIVIKNGQLCVQTNKYIIKKKRSNKLLIITIPPNKYSPLTINNLPFSQPNSTSSLSLTSPSSPFITPKLTTIKSIKICKYCNRKFREETNLYQHFCFDKKHHTGHSPI